MTDQPELATTHDDGDLFVTVPGPAWAHDIETRLADLEAGTPHEAGQTVGGYPADAVAEILTALDTYSTHTSERITVLEGQLRELEARTGTAEGRVDGVQDRADRFRADLEAVKKHQNDLVEWIRKTLGDGAGR